MKKKTANIVMVISCALILVACSKDDSNNPNNSSANQTANIAQSGAWEITYFYDTDKDETANFSGYTFNFNEDGSLVATKGTTTVNGSWSVQNDDDSSSNDSHLDFNILFQVPENHNFDDLNEDWDVISATENKIELSDISEGNGDADYLTFIKI